MNIRLNSDGVLKLACALFLAGAIGFPASASATDHCGAAARTNSGEIVFVDINNGRLCDMDEPNNAGRGRPGMRFVNDLA